MRVLFLINPDFVLAIDIISTSVLSVGVKFGYLTGIMVVAVFGMDAGRQLALVGCP